MDIVTLADRPELEEGFWGLAEVWPEFMLHDLVGGLFYGRIDKWLDHIVVAIEEEQVIARGVSVGFHLPDGDPLPDDGWSGVISMAHWDEVRGREPTMLAALEISIAKGYQGRGLSATMVRALRDNAQLLGYRELIVPVRPSHKHLEPRTPMAEYVERTREDGLPTDAWLRVHVRLGAEIIKVCPTAMTIPGTLAEWRAWTGLPFDQSGTVEVPGALVPVHVDLANDHAVYIEPNVWLRHAW